MTLPHERTRAVIECEAFLRQLAFDIALPRDIRSYAHHILRHYPSASQILAIGRLEELLQCDALDCESLRLITARSQRLFSSTVNFAG
ncbi:BPSL0761 family protein [Stutzerimonas chloritidismutans]|uniref:BPSL0761 family protein n=1 Tax=Stutzerimonas chloritidismutans TaxID=203192 RepID=UPI003F5CDCE7